MSHENTGLPCPDCGKKQERLNIQWDPNRTGVSVHISVYLLATEVVKEVKGLCVLLKMMCKP